MGGLIVLAVLAVFVLTNTDWGREQLRRRVVAALAGTVHGQLRVGRITGNLLKGLTLHDVAIADSAGAPFVRLDSISTRYGLRSFVSKRIELSDVTLWRPVVVLDRPPGGPWNYERIFPSDTTAPKDTSGVGWGDWLIFRQTRVVDGRITIRTPWSPDSALAGAARDSVVAAALAGDARQRVVRAPGGFQQVQDFAQLTAHFPLLRLAHPDFPTRRVEVRSLRTVAQLFTGPPADVRQLAGAVELDGDSLWMRDVDVRLPASRAVLSVKYPFEAGDLTVAARADSVSLADVQFAYPPLPDSGTLRARSVAARIGDTVQTYALRGLRLATGGATAEGDVGLALGDTLRVYDTDLRFAGVDTRLVEALAPGVELPRQGTFAGHVVADGSAAGIRLDGDVTFDDRLAGRNHVLARGEIGTADGVVRMRDLRVTLDPVQVGIARSFVSGLPVGGTVRGTATLDGSTAGTLVARGVDLTHADRGERSRVTGRVSVTLDGAAAPPRGRIAPREVVASGGEVARNGNGNGGTTLSRIDADLRLRPLSLVTVGRFAPAVGLRGAASGPVRVQGALGDLLVNSALTLSDGGGLDVRGRLDLTGTLGYDVDVRTRLFNANTVVATAPATSLTARLSADGRGTDPATMRATVAADLTTSTVDRFALDSSRLRLRVGGGLLTVDTAAVRAPRTAVDVVGTFGLAAARSGELSYRVAVDSLAALRPYFPKDTGLVAARPLRVAARQAQISADSAARAQRAAVAAAAGDAPPGVTTAATAATDTAPAALARDSIAGAAYAAGTLRGNLKGFDVRGRAGGVGIVALGSSAQRARVAYTWLGALRPDAVLAAAVAADSIRAAGFALDSVDARLTYREPGGTAQVAIYQDVGRDYSARADYALYTDRRELRLGQVRLRFDTTVWRSTRPGTVAWGQPGVEVDDVELVNPAVNGRVYVDGRLPTGGAADLRAEVRNFELADVLGLVQSDVAATGRVSADMRLTGPLTSPSLTGQAAFTGGAFRGTPVPDVRATLDYANLNLTARADATFADRVVARAEGVVPLNLALEGATGPRLPDLPARASLRTDSLPLDLISRFTDVVSNVRGSATGQVNLTGTLRRPTLAGALRLDSAQMRLVPTGVTLARMNGALRLAGDSVVIDSLTAWSGGRIRVSGGLGIRDAAKPSFDLRLAADNATVLDNEQGRIRANAQIAMYGPFDGVVVSGGARVREGVIYIPKSDNRETVNANDPAVFAVVDTARLMEEGVVASESPLLKNLRMDLSLAVDRDTWVRSQEANIEIYSDGDLRVRIDRASEAIFLDGIVNTDRGQYEFLSKRFQIRRGSAQFTNTRDIDPNLQITGEIEAGTTQSGPLIIRLVIGGTLRAPRLALESDAQPPIPQTDLLSYLAFGSASGDIPILGGGGQSSLAGGSQGGGLVGTARAYATQQLTGVVLGVAVNELEAQTARSLGADVVNITPAAGVPAELASLRTGGIEQLVYTTQFEIGKYLGPNTFVALQSTPTFYKDDPPIPGFRAEHRFGPNAGFTLQATWQPRFFLPVPTLGSATVDQRNTFGFFLARRWRF